MIAQKNRISNCTFFLRITLTFLVLLSLSGLCCGYSPNFGHEFVTHNEGVWYTLRISYPLNDKILNGNDVKIWLEPLPDSKFESITPQRPMRMTSESQRDWDLELKPESRNVKLVLLWELIDEKLSGMTKPHGSMEIRVP